MSTAGGTSTLRRRTAPAVLTLATFYVATLFTLVAWAAVPILLGWTPMAISSGSMSPGIRVGDIVVVDTYDGRPLDEGTVVTYRQSGRLVTHRIAQVDQDTYITKGDANQDVDSTPLTADAIVGTGRILVPYLARPYLWATTGQPAPAALWAITTLLAITIATTRPGIKSLPVPDAQPPERVRRRDRQLVRQPTPSALLLAAAGPTPAASPPLPGAVWHAHRSPSSHTRTRLRRPHILPRLGMLIILLLPPAGFGQAWASFAGTTPSQGSWAGDGLVAPTDLAATSGCSTILPGSPPYIELTWTPSAKADGYHVYRATQPDGTWEHQAQLDGGSTDTWRDDNVGSAGTTHTYRLEATAGTWLSDPSQEVSETVPEC